MAQKRKVEENYKAQAEKTTAEALAAASSAKLQHKQDILQLKQQHQSFAVQVETEARTAIDQEAAQMSAAQVQSQQQALEALAKEQVALQVAEVRKHSEHLVASVASLPLVAKRGSECATGKSYAVPAMIGIVLIGINAHVLNLS